MSERKKENKTTAANANEKETNYLNLIENFSDVKRKKIIVDLK